MNEQRRKELRRLCEGATEGPWMVFKNGPHHVAGICTTFSDSPDNAAFIAAARSAVPELLEENERLREALRPFAQPVFSESWRGVTTQDDHTVYARNTSHLTLGDFRAARAALETDHD